MELVEMNSGLKKKYILPGIFTLALSAHTYADTATGPAIVVVPPLPPINCTLTIEFDFSVPPPAYSLHIYSALFFGAPTCSFVSTSSFPWYGSVSTSAWPEPFNIFTTFSAASSSCGGYANYEVDPSAGTISINGALPCSSGPGEIYADLTY
ncbi:hypothetical protein [Isoalcanivorax pacificus]|uniref:hypothetical protein n=1 Tax=Isoalcanivorax pacificus TaxID=1306787 RepID=UPI0011853DD2|nr:hypothetical protein [Isoalcanivorax pacificus]